MSRLAKKDLTIENDTLHSLNFFIQKNKSSKYFGIKIKSINFLRKGYSTFKYFTNLCAL